MLALNSKTQKLKNSKTQKLKNSKTQFVIETQDSDFFFRQNMF